MLPIKRIILDLDYTVWNSHFEVQPHYLNQVFDYQKDDLFCNFGSWLSAYEAEHEFYDLEILSHFINEKLKKLNQPFEFNARILRGCFNSIFPVAELYPGVAETLAYLHNKYQIVACSNSLKQEQEFLLNQFQLRSYFDEVHTGDVAIKPYAKAYSIAAGDIPFEQCLFIGDTLEVDVKKPMELGMQAIWVSHDRENKYDGIKVKQLKEVTKIL